MSRPENKFETIARKHGQSGLAADFANFFITHKKWWLFPIVVLMIFFGLLVMLSGTGVAPFIYTLF